MSKLLIAKPIIDSSIEELKQRTLELKNKGLAPKMGVILVGENQASLSYIKNKRKMCQDIGAEFELFQLDENITKEEFLEKVNFLNTESSFTGCFVQLPIPKQLKELDTSTLINPNKDIDGFHTNSTVALYRDTGDAFIPCTPKGILKMLDHYQYDIEGKNIVIIGRSFIVGKPLFLLLSNKSATVTLCHSKTVSLQDVTKSADIIISAVGSAKYLTEDYLNNNGQQVVIDVGMNRDPEGKLCGDVDFSNVQDKVASITPVPGSVGPMTVLTLLENLIIATEKSLETNL
jgi:methylenetetrahydrofolate dehydrogenase (NADP+)/methenyltetrahydrofolate cyclohydrolase